jgi:hypothetical protein
LNLAVISGVLSIDIVFIYSLVGAVSTLEHWNRSVIRRSREADAFHQIHTKRLKTTERVTAVGFSSAPGDAIVKGIGGDGTIELFKQLHQEEGTITRYQRFQIDYNLP